jgi:2,4-dienoyl-CoA reductase-like NADH-dependent reductase (Old Yellow Enzyme family)
MRDSDPQALFRHVAQELGRRQVAFVCVREHSGQDALTPVIRESFRGPLVLNEGYDADSALRAIDAGRGEAVAFGKAFVSNPDLVERLRIGEPLRPSELHEAVAG